MYYTVKDDTHGKLRYFHEDLISSSNLDENDEGTVMLTSGHQFHCIGVIEEDLRMSAKEFYEDKNYYQSVIKGLTNSIKKKVFDDKAKPADIKALMSLRDDTIKEYETLGGKVIEGEGS